MTARTELTMEKRARLEEFFGRQGSAIIIKNFDNLEQAFGSAASVIMLVINGNTAIKRHYTTMKNDKRDADGHSS